MTKTTHSTQTHVGDGCYRQIYYTEAISEKVDGMCLAPRNTPLYPGITDEEKLFFATIAGEAGEQGIKAWMAIASVIMNRVGRYDWKKLTTVTEVIEKHAAFSAYKDHQGKPNPAFVDAMRGLNEPKTIPCESFLYSLIQVTLPIYKGLLKPITPALWYYSPSIPTPKFIRDGLADGAVQKIEIPGVLDKDFLFYTYTEALNALP